MQERKGRASYLGERSVGHQDPGATSTALLFRMITFYLPPLWGSFAMRWMRANRYL